MHRTPIVGDVITLQAYGKVEWIVCKKIHESLSLVDHITLNKLSISLSDVALRSISLVGQVSPKHTANLCDNNIPLNIASYPQSWL